MFLDLMKNKDNLYAHYIVEEDRKETIIQHSENVLTVFNYIDSEYKILDKLYKSFSRLEISRNNKNFFLSKTSLELIRDFFINAIYMHDFGKVSPKYQSKRLSNNILKIVDGNDIERIRGFIENPVTNTHHSTLSALMYLDYYIEEISKKVKGEERIFLIYLLFCFSNPIKSHHTELNNINEVFNQNNLNSILSNLDIFKDYLYFYKYKNNLRGVHGTIFDKIKSYSFDTMTIYIWSKILYSVLVSCDFIASYSFFTNKEVLDFTLNNKIDLKALQSRISEYPVSKGIEEYIKDKDYFKKNNLPLINELRSDIAIESINKLKANKSKRMFMIESPTGSGKTFNSINCSTNLLNEKSKLFYVFPVNTLATQTKGVLEDIFKGTINFQEINSEAPLPINKEGEVSYEKILLDNQLLNYEGIVTSNVALFNWLFSNKREHSMGLFSLFNSVIVLDEIQNYKNSIWKETIEFLYKYSEIMDFKVIIMSATLPKLDELIDFEKEDFIRLIEDTSIYYNNPLFKNRVKIDRTLLNKKIDNEFLLNHLTKQTNKLNIINKKFSKVIVEFITKKSCMEFYKYAVSNLKDYEIYHLDGDTNSFLKEEIVTNLKNKNYDKNVLLCTTQVIEAGVDIDMDIGYKDAVFPDVDEQFLGRINRSSSKENCSAFFFNLDEEVNIYKDDYRLFSNIVNPKYFNCLIDKNFRPLYEDYVFKKIDKIKLKSVLSLYNEFLDKLKEQNFKETYKKMQLIDNNTFNIFIPSVVNGINGQDIWEKYNEILLEANYAKKRVMLKNLKKDMSYFTYSVYGAGLKEEEAVGGIYYIEDSSKFIKDGKFDIEEFKENYSIVK